MEKITINLNRAIHSELQILPQIGKVRAEAIVGNRPFKDIYELSNVKGLGKVRMERIFEFVKENKIKFIV